MQFSKPVFAILLLASTAFGALEFVPIQERAQGQALTGSSVLNESLHSNPAGSTFVSVYAIDASYQLPRTFAVSILDTKTGAIGGGLAYFRKTLPGLDVPLQGAKISLSGKVSNTVGVGITGKSLWGPSTRSNSDSMTDLDAGMLVNFSPLLFGFTVRNVGGGNERMGFTREWSLGARYSWEDVILLSASATSNWNYLKPQQYGFGVEYMSPYYFSLKAGFRLVPDSAQSYWSFGTSINSPKLSLHYAVELPRQAGESVEHIVGTTVQL